MFNFKNIKSFSAVFCILVIVYSRFKSSQGYYNIGRPYNPTGYLILPYDIPEEFDNAMYSAQDFLHEFSKEDEFMR